MGEITQVAALASVVGAIIGYLGAVATFKSEFVRVDERHNALKGQIERDRVSDAALRAQELRTIHETLDRIERGQRVTLRLAADMARASGIRHRALGEDVLARYLAETPAEGEGDNDK